MVNAEQMQQPQWQRYVEAVRQSSGGQQRETPVYAVLFVSLDVVNSSGYKTIDPCKWEGALSEIMRHAIADFETTPSGGYDFWKLLGDEVIYTRKIYFIEEIGHILDDAYGKMQQLNRLIEQGVVCDEQASKLLGIKATAWIGDISTSCGRSNNVYTEYEIKDNRRQSDYTGADIDTGFRVSAYSMKNRLMISCKLAHILCKVPALRNHVQGIKLLGYQSLKGVWDGEPYPIIAYHGDENVSFEKTIVGGATFKERLLQGYLENPNNGLITWDEQYETSDEAVLCALCDQRGVTQEHEELIELIQGQTLVNLHKTRPFKRIHCTVACYQADETGLSFLLVKEGKEEVWRLLRFNFYLRASHGFLFDIQDFCQDELGVPVRIRKNLHRLMDTPLAVELYDHVHEQGGTVPGELLLGCIQGSAPEHFGRYQLRMVRGEDVAGLEGLEEVKRQLTLCMETIALHQLA